MSPMAVLIHGSLLHPCIVKPKCYNRRLMKHSSCYTVVRRSFGGEKQCGIVFHLFKSLTFRIRSFKQEDPKFFEAPTSKDILHRQDSVSEEVLVNGKGRDNNVGISFPAKIAISLAIAAIVTAISVGLKQPFHGSSMGLQILSEGSSSSAAAATPVGFTFKVFKYRVLLPEYAPGWIYFWLLMAAGCGLFISEEALNIWVGISLSRMLSLDGTWPSFAESFSRNASNIISTVLWVYWGVCISDLIPFYLGKLFRQSGASDDVCSRLGIGKEKASEITQMVQKYGNLIGFVERFSLGVRNPTAFLAGTLV
ncbi:SNARE associated Golgi protein [Quillaja saponaria]|uniref:SNARE associated Golgi protein n=1 Tax=Quillaja saponaria TaxID=32244 RepID=A0AAD7LNP8_QUISA|nr:SNARE associated Golgi protein [Quillaja saponaria]